MAGAKRPKAPRAKKLVASKPKRGDAPKRKRATKHIRLPKIEASPDAEEADIDLGQLLKEQIVFLRRLQSAADLVIGDGGMSTTFLREARDISKSIASVVTEQRKWEKHEKDRVQALTPEETHMLVAEYLKEIDYDGRKIFRDIIIEFDGERSLLA